MPELAGVEFLSTIGQGAMGAVYLARQTTLNRYVAAKQILGAWNGDPEVLARFQREARTLAQLNHPNVVGVFDLTTTGNDIFLITEYVRGLLEANPHLRAAPIADCETGSSPGGRGSAEASSPHYAESRR